MDSITVFLLGTITVMKLKALLFRLYKVDSTGQKLSYKDSKVCGVLVFSGGDCKRLKLAK